MHSIKLLENDVATAKSEAIKEFAERLKIRLNDFEFRNKNPKIQSEGDWLLHNTFPMIIDTVVNEMTEVNENDRA